MNKDSNSLYIRQFLLLLFLAQAVLHKRYALYVNIT